MASWANLTDQQRGFIGDIFDSGQHLLSLINDILDLSKVEAGKMMLDLESVEVSSLFTNSLSIVRESAVARHVQLHIEVAAELGSIQADARKVKQIVYNLLSNAVKFTVDGGRVTLRARRVPRAEVGKLDRAWPGRTVAIADSDAAEYLKVSVVDTGIGISPAGLEHLFKPFNQVDSGLARKFEGTGLGLAMVKMLAELHGGGVAVQSMVGEGSCFTIWLPIRDLTAAVAPSSGHPVVGAAVAPGTRTALVVDDDPRSAELIRLQLEAEGFEVLHATSAETALVVAAQQPLALITLDLMLPNMDGWEFLGHIKQVKELRAVPVLIISIVADRNKGFALGAAAIMQKPLSRLELYECLSELGLFPLPRGGALKILVVDDDPKAVELIVLRVQGLATSVLRAHGGHEAVDAARRELPDLIVLDLMMPDLDGFGVVDALRDRKDTAAIPVLVVTAKDVTDAERVRLNGFVMAILEKSKLDGERITGEVRRAMAGRHPVAV